MYFIYMFKVLISFFFLGAVIRMAACRNADSEARGCVRMRSLSASMFAFRLL